MSSFFGGIDIGSGGITLSVDNRTNSYTLLSPSLSGGANVTITLPDSQGLDGQVLTKVGTGSTTTWSNISSSSSGIQIQPYGLIFSSCFVQNNGSDFISFAGSSSDGQVCRFMYPAGRTATKFSCVIASNSGASFTTILKLVDGDNNVISTIRNDSLGTTPAIVYSNSFTGIPQTDTIVKLLINVSGSSSNKVNIYSVRIE